MKKVAAMAEVFNAQMAPHLYAGPVEWAANIHLAASIPNILLLESIDTPFHDRLIKGSIRVENGFVSPPEAPGLGIDQQVDVGMVVDVDEAWAHGLPPCVDDRPALAGGDLPHPGNTPTGHGDIGLDRWSTAAVEHTPPADDEVESLLRVGTQEQDARAPDPGRGQEVAPADADLLARHA